MLIHGQETTKKSARF